MPAATRLPIGQDSRRAVFGPVAEHIDVQETFAARVGMKRSGVFRLLRPGVHGTVERQLPPPGGCV